MLNLLKFFLLTFAVTWTCYIAAVVISHTTASDQSLLLIRGLLLVGTFAPAFVALAITARAGGAVETMALLRRLFQWRAGVRWYVFAIAYMAAIKLMVAVAHRLMAGSWPPFGHQMPVVILTAIIISTPVQSGEEIGWRGYALPRLAQRFGFARASVVLGLIWACWHLPLFFLRVPGNEEYGQPFPMWALGVTALSVAFAWLYVHTNGSLLLTMLMHAAVNNIPHFVPPAVADAKNTFSLHASMVAWLSSAFLWIAAAYFLVRMAKAEGADAAEAASGGKVI